MVGPPRVKKYEDGFIMMNILLMMTALLLSGMMKKTTKQKAQKVQIK